MSTETSPNLARIATQTLQILNRLRDTTTNDRLTYTELGTLAGCEVKPLTPGYSYLYQARRLAEQEGVFFSAIRKTSDFHGIQRISDTDAVSLASKGRNSIRRRARLESKRLVYNKGFKDFNSDTKNLWNGHMTFFRMVDHFTKPSLVKKVEEAVIKNGQPLQIEDTLAMFRK